MKRKLRVLAIVCIMFFFACAVWYATQGNVGATSGYAIASATNYSIFILAGGIKE